MAVRANAWGRKLTTLLEGRKQCENNKKIDGERELREIKPLGAC
jgi:hypothetical protein